ncbi:MAG: HlyD family efflux transporter periplasmic adaptor subunit [Pseudomonadota bacterium]
MQELTRTRAELAAVEASAVALADKVRRREITAPMAGTVKRIAVTTIGGVLQPGTTLLEIVPEDDTLLVEGKVKPADVAFLHPGQSAAIRISAYDSTIYGTVPASLEHISADTIMERDGQSFYLVRVRADLPQDSRMELMPGMTAIVDIMTAKQSVLDYLLKPIRKARDTALRER